MRTFQPFFRNRHLATIAGNFWPRDFSHRPFPETPRLFETEPGIRVLGIEQSPLIPAPQGDFILLHGLEGSHDSGYMVSMAQAALEAGFRTLRLNMRTCGGTEHHCPTLYHAGLTSDLAAIIRQYAQQGRGPVYLAGFSLGGNVVLKLTGELGADASLLAGTVAISTPIDLDACCRQMMRWENRIYERRFVGRLKARYLRRCAQHPDRYSPDALQGVESVIAFDDRVTAQHFGFGSAENYYRTQSAQNFLAPIATPTLVVQAEDDPLIPFRVYGHPAFQTNPHLQLVTTRHGGHVGFVSRTKPRFWVDELVTGWLQQQAPASTGR